MVKVTFLVIESRLFFCEITYCSSISTQIDSKWLKIFICTEVDSTFFLRYISLTIIIGKGLFPTTLILNLRLNFLDYVDLNKKSIYFFNWSKNFGEYIFWVSYLCCHFVVDKNNTNLIVLVLWKNLKLSHLTRIFNKHEIHSLYC